MPLQPAKWYQIVVPLPARYELDILQLQGLDSPFGLLYNVYSLTGYVV